jgi:murein hydrolase activator
MHFKIALLFIILTCFAAAQDNTDRELKNNRNRLSKIKSELSDLKKQLSKSQKDALSVNKQISLLDKEISLIAHAKGLMVREQRILEKRAKNNRVKLAETKAKLKKLKKLYAERLVYMYKYGKIKNLALLLTSNSFNQAFIRFRYLKMIAEYDEKTIASINNKQKNIERIQAQLADDIDAKNRSIREKQKEEQNYNASLDKKNSLLKRIKKDQSFYNTQIKIKKQEQAKLTSLIAVLERTRKAQKSPVSTEEFVTIDFENFKKGRGKLPWPVKGKVVNKFGRQYDPVSKTSINNSGIEIQAKIGTPVKCVFTGVVRMITYLGGYGNTIIIDHGNGYYTVYSYLGEIYVRKNDVVETNQIIAQVGDSGSLAGSKLHFEIYGGKNTYNPQVWLR